MIEVTVKKKVTREMVRDALTHAFEAESSGWACSVEVVSRGDGDFKEGDELYRLATWVPLTPGGVVGITDAFHTQEQYANEDGLYLLTYEKILKGIQLFSECKEGKIPEHFDNFLEGDSDGCSGDVFLQFCVFGDAIM